MLGELERECIRRAVRGASQLPSSLELFVNTSVEALSDVFLREMEELVRTSALPSRIVLELSERTESDDSSLRDRVARCRELGWKLGEDNIRRGYSGLGRLKTGPDCVKLPADLTRGHDFTPSLRALADAIRAQIVASQIESIDDLDAVHDAGVRYAQAISGAVPRRGFRPRPTFRSTLRRP